LLLLAPPVLAQDVAINWETKVIVDSPSTINERTPVVISVQRINDLLYDYMVNIRAVPRTVDDFSALRDLLTDPVSLAGTDACSSAVGAVGSQIVQTATELRTLPALNPTADTGKPRSVKLSETEASWNRDIEADLAELQKAKDALDSANANEACAGTVRYSETLVAYNEFMSLIEDFRDKLTGDHETEINAVLQPDHDYVVTVTETYQGKVTEDGEHVFTFSPGNNTLTLSAGILLSGLQNVTYEARKVPGNTENEIVPTGVGSPTTYLAALLNYRIPGLSNDRFGLAASSGPIITVGGSNETSSLGFLAGISMDMWSRFFVTVGAHVGEYADFPQGFDEMNRTVPANFGELAPVVGPQITWAIGFTYRTAGFGGLKVEKKSEKKPEEQPAGEGSNQTSGGQRD
jgi:hypothetical protein